MTKFSVQNMIIEISIKSTTQNTESQERLSAFSKLPMAIPFCKTALHL